MKQLVLCASVMLLAACACPGKLDQEVSFQNCPAERSKMCTRDYRPVCGVDPEGTEKTFPNGCSACAQENVEKYTEGACASDEQSAE